MERIAEKINPKVISYIGGDIATVLDTSRVAGHGVRGVQINTGGI